MAKKIEKKLPVLIITDEIDGSEKRYISKQYVHGALMDLKLCALQYPDQTLEQIQNLLDEINSSV